MNLFKRTKSIVTKNSGRQSESAPASATSSRQPLVPQTNVDLQSSLASPSDYASSTSLSSSDKPSPKRVVGAKISHRDAVDDNKSKSSHSSSTQNLDARTSHGLLPPPKSPPHSVKSNYSDMYTQNDLQTFSFGAALSTPSSSSLYPPLDPLSRPRDEADSDEISMIPDTTPRPSVVGNQHSRIHNSQPSGVGDSPNRTKPPGRSARSRGKARAQDSDTASSHTFGTSSASASLSSLSGPRGANSRATSRISGYSSTTPQTSANDLTSDDDEDMIGRHPLPPEPRRTRPVRRYMTPDRDSLVDFSEDEFDQYTEEYEPDIEIESIAHTASDRGTYFDYSNPSQDSFAVSQSGRRGSTAIAIPSASSDNSFHDNRSREFSLVSGRRGSKSLEDLHSISFLKNSDQSSLASNQRPLPPAPTSFPESGGDWREVRKRSFHRDKDLPPIESPQDSPPTSTAVVPYASNGNLNADRDSSATDGFDTAWMQTFGVNGVVGFDPSEMTDIVGEGNLNGHRPAFYAFRKGSAASANRRQSTVSSMSVDIMHKNISGPWANQKYLDQRQMWTYMKEKEGVEEDSRRRITSGNERERDRPSIATLFAPRPSTSTGPDHYAIVSSTFFDKPDSKDKDKLSVTKHKPHKEPWCGMRLDSQETWFNGFGGKYRVLRKNAISLEPGKPPQQRLHVNHMRTSYTDGPTVTIHKHSKASAFSISRHYRPRSSSNSNGTAAILTANSSTGQVSSKESSNGTRQKSDMILLANRKVQIAYYSTNTTRKLDTHGLLDDNGRTSPRELERVKKENDRDRQRARAKERERDKQNIEAPSAGRSTVNNTTQAQDIIASETPLPDSSEGSSAGSVSNPLSSGDSGTLFNTSTPVTTPEQSEAHSSVGSVEQSIRSQETTSSDRTIIRTNNRVHHRKRGIYDLDDDYDEHDDSSDDMPRYPTRTPHRETYAALPPEVFESSHQDHPSTGLFGWGRSKGNDRHGHRANVYLENAYNPPWPVTQPRFNSETRKGIVDDLNTSFQDVGLLPAIGEIKGSSSHSGQHRRKRDQHPKKQHVRISDKSQTDTFEEVPDDALYMVLPLWPSETDPHSSRRQPYTMPSIATHARQYLLIYYKTPPPPPTIQEEGSKTKSAEKKRSQEASAGEGVNDRSVFLHTFHISARVFSYRDLQGSGIRIPDVGLSVCGSLKEAHDSIPACIRKDDYVIGVCHAREAGVEFVPEGFEKMGLSKNIPNPRPSEPSEDDDSHSFDTIAVLTPIGRAVMEMAWLGALAVTSFNPNHLV